MVLTLTLTLTLAPALTLTLALTPTLTPTLTPALTLPRQAWYAARRASSTIATTTTSLSPRRAALPSLLLKLMEPVVTLSVFAGCLASALSSCDAIGAIHLAVALLCSFGRAPRLAWLPVSLVSAVSLLTIYVFQLRLGGSRVVVSGCSSASPTVGCNLAWAGLDQIEASDWQVRVS